MQSRAPHFAKLSRKNTKNSLSIHTISTDQNPPISALPPPHQHILYHSLPPQFLRNFTLEPGAFWCITGTPNRLWCFDFHTAYLPFYFWLPDDLAFAYAKFSNRTGFRELYDQPTPENIHHFLRRGRGVSYHEFDLAIRPVSTLDIVSSMGPQLRDQRLLNKWRWQFTSDFAFESLLRRAAPGIHPGFFQRFLNILIRKD